MPWSCSITHLILSTISYTEWFITKLWSCSTMNPLISTLPYNHLTKNHLSISVTCSTRTACSGRWPGKRWVLQCNMCIYVSSCLSVCMLWLGQSFQNKCICLTPSPSLPPSLLSDIHTTLLHVLLHTVPVCIYIYNINASYYRYSTPPRW